MAHGFKSFRPQSLNSPVSEPECAEVEQHGGLQGVEPSVTLHSRQEVEGQRGRGQGQNALLRHSKVTYLCQLGTTSYHLPLGP